MLPITAIAASLLGFLYFKLSWNVIGFRRKYKVSVGDGGEENLLRAIRIQANLVEYAPIALILLACLELNNAPWYLVALFAIVFVAGRILHPMGMKEATSPFKPRVRGMQLTLVSIVAMSVANILMVVWRLVAA